jgi:hypothetical protein
MFRHPQNQLVLPRSTALVEVYTKLHSPSRNDDLVKNGEQHLTMYESLTKPGASSTTDAAISAGGQHTVPLAAPVIYHRNEHCLTTQEQLEKFELLQRWAQHINLDRISAQSFLSMMLGNAISSATVPAAAATMESTTAMHCNNESVESFKAAFQSPLYNGMMTAGAPARPDCGNAGAYYNNNVNNNNNNNLDEHCPPRNNSGPCMMAM